MRTNWKLIWANLREFSAGRSLERDYRWLKKEMNMAKQEAA